MTSETRVGATPNGGVKSIIYYRDKDGNPAEKEDAVRAEIVEFDANGQEINHTYGDIKPQ